MHARGIPRIAGSFCSSDYRRRSESGLLSAALLPMNPQSIPLGRYSAKRDSLRADCQASIRDPRWNSKERQTSAAEGVFESIPRLNDLEDVSSRIVLRGRTFHDTHAIVTRFLLDSARCNRAISHAIMFARESSMTKMKRIPHCAR